MATVVPAPSKRQKVAKLEQAELKRELNAIPTNLGSVRIQFVDEATGESAGAAISIPVADANVRNLELLLNTVQKKVESDRVPYRFAFVTSSISEGPQTGSRTIDIASDIYHSLLQPALKTTEEIIKLHFTPQAVFKVRAISRCSSSMPGHGEAILAASFSPSSSSRLLTGGGDKTARIWDCDTGTPVAVMKGHKSWVLVVSWSPDGSILATGSMDNTVRLWNPLTGEAHGNALEGHTKWVTAMAWEPFHLQAPSRPRLASSSKDSTVRIWDVVSRRIESVLSGHKGSVSCVKWGGQGTIYTSSHDKTVKVWDSSKATLIHTLSAHAHWVNHLALSTDFVLRTAYHDHTGKIPASEEEKIKTAKNKFEKAATVNGAILERLVTASDDFTMYLWEPSKSNKPLSRMLGHQKQVNHVTFSPDGFLIASAGWDNHVKLWNARDGQFITTFRGHVGPVYMTCFSADSRLLVSGSKDTTLKVWDVKTGKLKEDLPGHKDEVYAVDWSADGAKVGSGGKDKSVKIWRH